LPPRPLPASNQLRHAAAKPLRAAPRLCDRNHSDPTCTCDWNVDDVNFTMLETRD
jgi:hypothetical protein